MGVLKIAPTQKNYGAEYSTNKEWQTTDQYPPAAAAQETWSPSPRREQRQEQPEQEQKKTVASRTPADLVTPTINSDVYTTGRGGSGNMVANDDPAIARKAQDVEVDVEGLEEWMGMGTGTGMVMGIGMEGGEKVLFGRGGAANIYDASTRPDGNKNTQ
ncbi:hypothetical protein BDDG_08933 [Blastomyces dermatitidis ATCC 18188]|uniref:Uncharacterized protein n=1 Tax=Ajellomyces dermatitidis (strain ATCC 18188 / CBS 674.68) TaxID=653446 RepID=F2TRX5_AJEDA|nr:hypothetical protein BDDG_08933 [Blastomyces dermatitidis ATCC 18188]